MLIELHSLTSHAPANLNRDDLGRPKTAVFGGTQRARISSQALKRSIRTSTYLQHQFKGALATRSRQIPERLIYRPLLAELGEEHEARLRVICELVTSAIGKPDAENKLNTSQIVFMTEKEIDSAKQYARGHTLSDQKLTKDILKDMKANAAKEMNLNVRPSDAVDLAMFGRMTTDEEASFAAVDASVQVAHALSTHTVVPEVDWFTAVDDITAGNDERGSGHLGEVEFNSAVFYKYFSCNLPLLVENLGGSASYEHAVEALAAVLETACRITPGGKQNTFAAHNQADTVLLVIRDIKVPVSLANAFERPIQNREGGYLEDSRIALARHYADLVEGYALPDTSFCFVLDSSARETVAALLPESVTVINSMSELFATAKASLVQVKDDMLKGSL